MLSLTSTVRTPWHHIAPGPKLLALLVLTIVLFRWNGPGALTLVGVGVVGMYLAGGKAFALEGLRLMRPVFLFVALMLAWHLFTSDLAAGMRIVGRVVVLVAFANLITMTTRLSDMIDLVLRLLNPLRRLGVPTGAIGLAIAMVIRFTPRLSELLELQREAWRARSTRRPGVRIAIPLTLAALDDADRVAEALKARGGVPRE